MSSMLPRAHSQRDINPPRPQCLVLLNGLSDEDVLPTADQQCRRLNPLQRIAVVISIPVRIAQVGVLQPFSIPRSASIKEGLRDVCHGQPRESGVLPPQCVPVSRKLPQQTRPFVERDAVDITPTQEG